MENSTKVHQNMKVNFFLFLSSLFLLIACKPEMEPINFGHEGCSYCQMTIVDPRYAAELVTDKGKVYKFDAIECMINYTAEHTDTNFDIILVSTIDEKELKDAATCIYLRSRELPSPMGKYITGISNSEMSKKLLNDFGGKLYSWSELNKNFKNLPSISQ
jgi:copper chaperone NosL